MRPVSFAQGLLYGFGIGIALVAFGFLLSLTLIGMILGVPMIIVGVCMFLTAPIAFKYMKIAECPNCQESIIMPMPRKHIKCRSCKRKFFVKKDNTLLQI